MKLGSRTLGVALVAALLPLTACSTQEASTSDLPEGWVLVDAEFGSVARPARWRPQEAQVDAEVDTFAIREGGEVVAQMDVLRSSITPGTDADAVAAALQGARIPSFPQLRHTRREFVEVPGADSAFLTESTYLTADSGEDARSLDQVAVAEDGRYLLVRLSALAEAYDAELFEQVVSTMRLDAGSSDS